MTENPTYEFSKQVEAAKLGESPVWDAAQNAVWWVDIDGYKLNKTNISTRETISWTTPERAGFVVLTASNRPALGMETGIFALNPATSTFEKHIPFDGLNQRFNDACVDMHGRLWASTMSLSAKEGAGVLFRVAEDAKLETLQTGLTIPNGLAADPLNARIYFSDSFPKIQTIWQTNSGLEAEFTPQEFAQTHELDGRPDGAAIDAEGNYLIAGVDGGEVYIFAPDGKLQHAINCPTPYPTKPVFVGDSLNKLAITSKGQGENGGLLAPSSTLSELRGMAQSYWTVGAPK